MSKNKLKVNIDFSDKPEDIADTLLRIARKNPEAFSVTSDNNYLHIRYWKFGKTVIEIQATTSEYEKNGAASYCCVNSPFSYVMESSESEKMQELAEIILSENIKQLIT